MIGDRVRRVGSRHPRWRRRKRPGCSRAPASRCRSLWGS